MTPSSDHAAASRATFWRSLGASPGETDELLAYAANRFDDSRLPDCFPLPDAPFVEAWTSYAEEARGRGVLACLREHLLQLRFPIQAGISASESYRAAIQRGELGRRRPGRYRCCWPKRAPTSWPWSAP
jgi:hypothetical protein